MMKKNKKVIFLLDMDAFFASCHIAIDPNLIDKNVVVSSPNRRAIITTASYNARSFGVKVGMPLFKAKELCPNLVQINSDFSLYINFSQKVFDIIFQNFTKKIEVASIDECYLDVTDIWKKYKTVKNLAQAIQRKIFKELNLTCSIGISTNKFLAKSCVDFNKPNGVSFLLPEDINKILWPLEISKMFMVGPSTKKILNENNVFTIGDLAMSDLNKIIKILGKRGLTLWSWANGVGDDNVEYEANELKSIGNEFTLNFTTSNPEEIEEMIYELSLKVSQRARKRFLKGKTISIIIKYANNNREFNLKERKKHNTKQETISEVTNSVEKIYSVAKECFYELWNGEQILLIGVRLNNLVDAIQVKKQLTFEDIDLNDVLNLNDIGKIIYDLELKFGKKLIFTADQLIKFNDKNRSQSKYLKNDNVHISNEEVLQNDKNTKDRRGYTMQEFINIDDFILEIRLIHNQLNALLFKNKLKPVKIVVEDNRRIKKKHTLGSFMPYSGYVDQENSMQIVIYTLCLNGNYYDIIETLIHEMVHQSNFQNQIKDTENNGRHNKNFRDTALSVGLYIEPTVRGNNTNSHGLGFAFTKLSDYLRYIIDNKLDFNKQVLQLKHQASTKIVNDQRIAYRCEGCDFRVTTKQDVRLKCLGCNLELSKTIK